MSSFRLYHLILAVTAVLACLTGEAGIIHDWLGYAVGAVLVVRLLLSLGANRQFGFSRFLPSTAPAAELIRNPNIGKALLAAVLLSVVVVTGTGILMDQGRALGLSGVTMITSAQADDGEETEWAEGGATEESEGDNDEGFLYEVHEASANLMLLFVALHATWLISFRRPLALYVLFISKKKL